jgi:hypothetical protein
MFRKNERGVERSTAFSGFVDGVDAPTNRHRNVPL